MKKQLLIIAMFAAAMGNAQNAINTLDYAPDAQPLIVENENLLNLTSLPDYGLAGTYSISGELNSKLAGDVKSATISYIVDNGQPITEKITPEVGRSVVDNFRFQSDVNLSVGNHIVKVWASEINGVQQLNPQVVTTEVHIASRAAKRHGLIELFTSSTCPPCAAENKTLDPLLVKNTPNIGGDLNVVKYQMNWPSPSNDPSYNSHGNARKSYYGIGGIPDGKVNGKAGTFNTQSGLDASKTAVATVDIDATISVTGNNIQAKATITPYVTSTVTIHQVMIQDYYTYSGAAGQTKYYFAERKMNPDGGGAKNTAITNGTPLDVKFDLTATQAAKPAQGSFDFWTISTLHYQYVVFVQDDKTKAVLNSASGKTSTVGIVDIKKDTKIGVYPNPADDYAVIGIKLEKESGISLNIYDISGKVVYNNEAPQAAVGQNEITINTTNFASGMYTIVVRTSDGILREKLMVN